MEAFKIAIEFCQLSFFASDKILAINVKSHFQFPVVIYFLLLYIVNKVKNTNMRDILIESESN